MCSTISVTFNFLIKNVLILFLLFPTSCQKNRPSPSTLLKDSLSHTNNQPHQKDEKRESLNLRKAKLLLPSGKLLHIDLAITIKEKVKGLSGIQNKDYPPDQGMLFIYQKDQARQFWMPNTYFNLDIFFLDHNLKVLSLERNVPHHPGRRTPPAIARTKKHWSRHVLELKSSSSLAKEIQVGNTLRWNSKRSLQQIILNTHQQK